MSEEQYINRVPGRAEARAQRRGRSVAQEREPHHGAAAGAARVTGHDRALPAPDPGRPRGPH